jgi:hypothetical protein
MDRPILKFNMAARTRKTSRAKMSKKVPFAVRSGAPFTQNPEDLRLEDLRCVHL